MEKGGKYQLFLKCEHICPFWSNLLTFEKLWGIKCCLDWQAERWWLVIPCRYHSVVVFAWSTQASETWRLAGTIMVKRFNHVWELQMRKNDPQWSLWTAWIPSQCTLKKKPEISKWALQCIETTQRAKGRHWVSFQYASQEVIMLTLSTSGPQLEHGDNNTNLPYWYVVRMQDNVCEAHQKCKILLFFFKALILWTHDQSPNPSVNPSP